MSPGIAIVDLIDATLLQDRLDPSSHKFFHKDAPKIVNNT
jgi:hypothetical protein